MNVTKTSEEIKAGQGIVEKPMGASAREEELEGMRSAFTAGQRAAIGFAAGVIGALAVVLFSHLLFRAGISAMLG